MAYDDGDRRWHGENEYGEYKVFLLPAEATAEADVVCTEEPWEKLELRCANQLMRLADPAKGRRCARQPLQLMLRAHAARAKVCPIVGCDAPLARTHEVQRDDALRAALAAVPAAVDVVWRRGPRCAPRRRLRRRRRSPAASGGGRRRCRRALEDRTYR